MNTWIRLSALKRLLLNESNHEGRRLGFEGWRESPERMVTLQLVRGPIGTSMMKESRTNANKDSTAL